MEKLSELANLLGLAFLLGFCFCSVFGLSAFLTGSDPEIVMTVSVLGLCIGAAIGLFAIFGRR